MTTDDSGFEAGGEANGPFLDGELSMEDFAPAAGKHRGAQRIPVSLPAGFRQSMGSGISVQIMDLSTDGFRTETHLDLEPGAKIWVRLPGLESTPATVAWVRGYAIGCAFERPLHPAVLDLIVAGARS
jgi:hypothetical protein